MNKGAKTMKKTIVSWTRTFSIKEDANKYLQQAKKGAEVQDGCLNERENGTFDVTIVAHG